jgi:hypothetical protein
MCVLQTDLKSVCSASCRVLFLPVCIRAAPCYLSRPMSNEIPAPTPVAQPQQQSIPLQVKYEDMTARYANHVLLNTGQEELYLDFSSGLVVDRAAGVSVMPIHTRIAMTPAGVVRLWQLLGQAVQNFQVIQTGQQGAPAAPSPVTPEPPQA